jgi:flagellar biosynthesis/type III secretory pathway chaperone
MPDTILADLDRLLDEERAALLSGNLAALPTIVVRKEALSSGLAIAAPSPAARRLRRKAERNAELLAAAGKAIRGVIRRMAEIRSANGPLKTYGCDGTQQTFGSAAGSFEKRA